MREEIWKDVAGFEGAYQVSSLGRVRSLTRKVMNRPMGEWLERTVRGRIISQATHPLGYKHVVFSVGNVKTTQKVHRLVAVAFINNPSGLPHVNHIDANTGNNSVSNLEWVTHKQNMEHASRLGLMVSSSGPGEESPAHKLTDDDVIQIKLRIMLGDRICKIAADYPIVTNSAISEIKAGRSWGHIKVTQDMYHEAMARRAA